jgi:peptidyl-prolyl cis-trans isomerase SurA
MRKLSFLLFLSFASLVGCKNSGSKKSLTKSPQPILQSVGDQPVYSSEFAYVYKKNNANSEDAHTEQSVREYLRLYTNFKLKVRAAEDLGLDTSKAFIKELDGYKKQLAQPYLTEKSLTEKFAKQAYARMQEEVNASHILIGLTPDASPKDTLQAYNKIMAIRDKIPNSTFEQLALEFSEDPSVKVNSGNLGYFTALQMVYPFEDAAFNMKTGEVSMPVRTKFGYHLIKIKDKRPSQGEIKVAHFMIRSTAGNPDSLAARENVFEVYNKLKSGEDWATLVSQFSEDKSSKSNAGELPWFSTGRMIPSFEDAAFMLKEVGDFTSPVLTPYGWHIIKLLDRKGLSTYEELEGKIKQKVSKDRSDYYRAATFERLKKENNFVENSKSLETALTFADSSLLKGVWSKDAGSKEKQVLFLIKDQTYTIKDFFVFVKGNQSSKSNGSPQSYMTSLYKQYVEKQIFKYEEEHLEDKYEDYRMLVKEYRDGILLFQLMDEKVWTKAIEDTAGLKSFFNANRDRYKWDTRVHATIVNSKNKAILEKVKEDLKHDIYKYNSSYSPVSFGSGLTAISDSDKDVLNKASKEVSKNKELVIELSGFASAKEAVGGNADIADKRALVVKEYLMSKGVDEVQIKLKPGIKAGANAKGNNSKVNLELFSKSVKDLEKTYNSDAPLSVQITKGVYQKGDQEVFSKIAWKEGDYQFEEDGRFYLVKIAKVEEPRNKLFEEARGLAISDYQTYLEEQWLKELRVKYPVKVNEEEVLKLITK